VTANPEFGVVRSCENIREYKRVYDREYRQGKRRTKGRRSVLIRLMAKLRIEQYPENEALGECWVFIGALNSDGYGTIRGDIVVDEHGKRRQPLVLTHRVALAAALGRPIAAGMFANHKCRNVRHCCRPSHLYEGTQSENELDKHGQLGWERRMPIFGMEVAQ